MNTRWALYLAVIVLLVSSVHATSHPQFTAEWNSGLGASDHALRDLDGPTPFGEGVYGTDENIRVVAASDVNLLNQPGMTLADMGWPTPNALESEYTGDSGVVRSFGHWNEPAIGQYLYLRYYWVHDGDDSLGGSVWGVPHSPQFGPTGICPGTWAHNFGNLGLDSNGNTVGDGTYHVTWSNTGSNRNYFNLGSLGDGASWRYHPEGHIGLVKGAVYRFELRIFRESANMLRWDARVFEGDATTPIYTNEDWVHMNDAGQYTTTVTLADNPDIPYTSDMDSQNCLAELMWGVGGQGGIPAGVRTYTGAVAVRVSDDSNDWVGPYGNTSSGPNIVWESDWSTATGMGDSAILDGGAWSGRADWTPGWGEVVPTSSLPGQWPSGMNNALRSWYGADMWGGGAIINNGYGGTQWDVPQTGETLFYRWYVSNNIRDAAGNIGSSSNHPFQGFDISQGCTAHWESRYGSNSDGTFNMDVHFIQNGGFGWHLPDDLPKFQPHLIELAFTRVAPDQYTVRARVNGVDRSDDLVDYQGVSLTDFGPMIIDDYCLQTMYAGNNGPLGWESADPSQDYFVWAGVAVAIDSDPNAWIGPYGEIATQPSPEFVFHSDWSHMLGNTDEATTDNGVWNFFSGNDRADVLSVVEGDTLGWTQTPNVLQVRRDYDKSAIIQAVEALPAQTNHWGRFYFRNDETQADFYYHNNAYNQLGDIQLVYWNRRGNQDGVRLNIASGGASWPFDDWRLMQEGVNEGYIRLPHYTWFRYEWMIEYASDMSVRIWPRVYDMSGTLLYDADNYFHSGHPSQGTNSLAEWYALGNAFSISDPELMRNIGISNEGTQNYEPQSLESWYIADYALSLDGWIGGDQQSTPPQDTTPPVATISAPSNGATLSADTTSTLLSVSTNEAATCRYSASDETYAAMANTLSGSGTTSHSVTLTGLTSGGFTFYVRCQDSAGNSMSSSALVSFSVAQAPVSYEGDANGDGVVNMQDILLVVSGLGRQTFDVRADRNSDDVINVFDLVLVAKHFGRMYESTDTRLVAHYSFDEGSGSSVQDMSANDNHGTVQGTAAWTTGVFGSALQLDGTSTYVSVPHDASLSVIDEITLMAWVNTPGDDYDNIIVKGGLASAYALFLYNRTIEYNLGSYTSTSQSVSADTWTHVALTYDGSTIRVYRNGQEVHSAPRSGALGTNTQALHIGAASGSSPFMGALDEVRVYNTALSAQEIQSIMNTN